MIHVADAVAAVRTVVENKGLDPGRVTPETTLRDLDLDSLDLAEALIVLEEKFGIELEPPSAGPFVTVADLAALAAREPNS